MPRATPRSAKKKTAFVPRIVFSTALAATSVIPLCACGGEIQGSGQNKSDSGITFTVGMRAYDASNDAVRFGVAACGFDDADPCITGVGTCAFEGGCTVAACAFDGGCEPQDATVFGVADAGFQGDADSGIVFTVAACAFDGGSCEPPDATFGVADVGFRPDAADTGVLGVAVGGFDASSDAADAAGSGGQRNG